MSSQSKRRYYSVALFLIGLIACLTWWVRPWDQIVDVRAATPQSNAFSVSGIVSTDSNPFGCGNAPVSQVLLTFSRISGTGAVPPAVQPSLSNRTWSQTGFEPGTVYRVTPSLAGYVFSPASYDFDGAKSDLNFGASKAPFDASGRVTDAAGNGIAGVTITFGPIPSTKPPAVQTDADGNWGQTNFPCLAGCGFAAGYFATPSKPGMVFLPDQRVFCAINTGLDFVGVTQPTMNVSAASYRGRHLARESIAAAFGSNLAVTTEAAVSLPLPTSLAGTRVKIKDSGGAEQLAPLFFVSPGQVNYQVPPGVRDGDALVTITNGNGAATAGLITVSSLVPGLFTANADGQGVAAAVVQRVKVDNSITYEAVAQFDAVQNRFVATPIDLGAESDQVFLILFGTGFRYHPGLSSVIATIGGISTLALYAGPQGDSAGLDQLNLRLPRSLAGRGEVDVQLSFSGSAANTVKVNIK